MVFKRIGGCLAALVLVLALSACQSQPAKPSVKSLEVQPGVKTLELFPGDSETVTVQVLGDGKSIADASLQWTSTDPAVATVSDGAVQAVSVGTAKVQVSVAYGGIEATETIEVTVCKSTVQLQPEQPVVIDLSKDDGGVVAFNLPVDKGDARNVLLGDTEYRILSQGDQTLIQVSSMLPGEYTMTVMQETQNISFPVYVATMVIDNAQMLEKATRLPNCDTGYFVLGSNIDCSSLSEPICFTANSVFETNLGQNRAGFRGGFNGMGYTVSNLKVPENGLFGCIAGCGVVRNVAFTNVQAMENVICLYSAGLISQVYVQGDFSQVLQHSFGPVNKLENIVAETVRADGILSGNIASVDTAGYSVSDVHALIMVGQNARISGYSRNTRFNKLVSDEALRVFSGDTKERIPAVTAEDGFNGYWDISSGYPVFLSSRP